MKLIQINIIGLQTAKVTLNRFGNGRSADGRAIAHIAQTFSRMFGCQNIRITPRRVFGVPGANNFFGAAYCFFGNWVDRIHFSRIDEIYSISQRKINLGMPIGLRGLAAEGHRSQTKLGYIKPAAAHRIHFHTKISLTDWFNSDLSFHCKVQSIVKARLKVSR